ncbi:MAG TPA: alanine racemase [Burkholderiaceae bacterium]|nr:alanine racemase [Burkholderiaceae bacterium]
MSAAIPAARSARRPADPPVSAFARIDTAAIAHNLRHLRRLAMGESRRAPRIWAVAKADAYGHSLVHALAGLEAADGLAVLALSDALQAREMGWSKPILVMSPRFRADDLRNPGLCPLHLVIDSEEQLTELHALRTGPPPHIWLRHSGQLHHSGFGGTDYPRAYRRLQELCLAGRVAAVGHLCHYAASEDPHSLTAERQAFREAIAGLPGALCTENSAALLTAPGYAGENDWVRSGIALYGLSPLPGTNGADLGLRPAMTLQAPIYGQQTLRAGSRLGYGGGFLAPRDMRIGLVRCGYADGYPRRIAEDAYVLIDSRKSRIVGRVSMDTLTIDLTGHPLAGAGTLVTLWGEAGLPTEQLARSAETIAPQLCTGLTARVPRLAATQCAAWAPIPGTPA